MDNQNINNFNDNMNNNNENREGVNIMNNDTENNNLVNDQNISDNNYQNNNFNSQYSNNQYFYTQNDGQNYSSYRNQSNNGYNNFVNDVEFKETTKKKKNGMKKIRLIAAGALIAVVGGVVGGGATYKVLDKFVASDSNDPVSYSSAKFMSSNTNGTLTTAEAFEKIKPAVVTISVTAIESYGYGFFNQSQEVEGIGSGFIIDKEGYIVTNYHVIENSTSVSVLLSTGEEVGATVVNFDSDKDLAVLKLNDGVEVPGYVELGDSDSVSVGEDVLAVGTPLSTEYAQTCTKGIVSSESREITLDDGSTMEAIQTDTAINPGNSGGPLVNLKGQVIGINSMKLVEDEVEGMGFAIPINVLKDSLDELKTQMDASKMTNNSDSNSNSGTVADESSVSLGITVSTASSGGAQIQSVKEGSSADEAGLKKGDIITKFNGKDISTSAQLVKAKKDLKVGDEVEVVYERDGKENTTKMTMKGKSE